MNLGQYREQLGEECGISTDDPWYPRLNSRVNRAIQHVGSWSPIGWDWLMLDLVGATWEADRTEMSFAELMALHDDDNLPDQQTVNRIQSVWVNPDPGVPFGMDLGNRSNRRNLEQWDPTVTGGFQTVCAWGVEHQCLLLRMVPAEDIGFSARMHLDERTLVDDQDIPAMPRRFDEHVMDYAKALVYEMKQDEGRATYYRKIFEEGMPRMLQASRPHGGGGHVPLGGP